MNRRGFLGMIAAGLAAAVDPERLLWEPGRKLISVPKPSFKAIWIGVEVPHFDMSFSDSEFISQYLTPALAEISDRIQAEMIKRYDLLAGPLPRGVTMTGAMDARLPNGDVGRFRRIRSYDVTRDRMIETLDTIMVPRR